MRLRPGMSGHPGTWGKAGEEALGAEHLSISHKVRVGVPGKARVSLAALGFPPLPLARSVLTPPVLAGLRLYLHVWLEVPCA